MINSSRLLLGLINVQQYSNIIHYITLIRSKLLNLKGQFYSTLARDPNPCTRGAALNSHVFHIWIYLITVSTVP
jgi:hypothetical protein